VESRRKPGNTFGSHLENDVGVIQPSLGTSVGVIVNLDHQRWALQLGRITDP
jgi:hypothetical protein